MKGISPKKASILIAVVIAAVASAYLGGYDKPSERLDGREQTTSFLPLKPVSVQMATQTMYHYKIELVIRPAVTISSPDQTPAGQGEMLMMASGKAVSTPEHKSNRHIDLRIFNVTTGAPVSDITPMVWVTDVTGSTRQVDMMAMYPVASGVWGAHFGNNVELPNGWCMVTILIGAEKAVIGIRLLPG